MKVFISWSGSRSKMLAQALRNFIPAVLQQVQIWSSERDIEVGTQWQTSISRALEEASAAVLCLTPENLRSPWLTFEAGAIAKSAGGVRVIPYLLGFGPADLTGPLALFQAAIADRTGTYTLIRGLNDLSDSPIEMGRLDGAFAAFWSRLQDELEHINSVEIDPRATIGAKLHSGPEPQKAVREVLNEVLERLKSLERLAPSPAIAKAGSGDGTIFIVHGHDHGTKETVARFVERLGLKVTILHELPNMGRTIIEKLEASAMSAFAIVLLTGDDRGGKVGAPARDLARRARQNVVLELGFFMGALGCHHRSQRVPISPGSPGTGVLHG